MNPQITTNPRNSKCKKGFNVNRCENKINLCENETCSGNGICQIISNNLSKNESIECKCYGIEQFEGKSSEIETINLKIRKWAIKISLIVSISILAAISLDVMFSDVFNAHIKNDKS